MRQLSLLIFFLYALPNAQGKADTTTILQQQIQAERLLSKNADTAQRILESGLKESLSLKFFKGEALCRFSLAKILENKGEYTQAMQQNLLALRICEQQQLLPLKGKVNNSIGNVLLSQQKYHTARKYYHLSMQIARQTNNPKEIAGELNNLAILYANETKFDSALIYFKKALTAFIQLKDTSQIQGSYTNIGAVYSYLQNPLEAVTYYKKGLHFALKSNEQYAIANTFYNLGFNEYILKKYSSAILHYQKCRTIAISEKYKDLQWQTALGLLECHLQLGNRRNAAQYLAIYQAEKDSLLNAENNQRVDELAAQYEAEKKDKELIQLSKKNLEERLARNQLTFWLAGVSAFFILCSAIGIIFYNKQRYQQQLQLASIEHQNKTALASALIEGENNERRRIAMELHDHVLNSLAAVTLYFKNMGSDTMENKNTGTNNESYTKGLDLLQKTNTDIRNLSHKLAVENLYGDTFNEAIHQYVAQMSKALKNVNILLDLPSNIILPEANKQIMLLRILQELISNTVKHAAANQIAIAFTQDNRLLTMNYADNGIGYDPIPVNQNEGIGLKNIKNRISYLAGELVIDSQKGKGMTAIVTIPYDL